MISVSMATYNGSRYIEQQLYSILSQLDENDEIILVDDCSSDNTLEVVESLDDKRIKIYRNDSNLGVLQTFERAIHLASGDIIFLSDQDDIWYPEKVSKFLQVFDQYFDVTLVLSDANVIDASDEIVAESFFEGRGGFSPNLWNNLAKNKYLGCTMAFRRSMVSKFLPFPKEIPMHDMWIGCINSIYGKSFFLDMPTIGYRRHQHNASPVKSQGFTQMVIWRWRLAKNLFLKIATSKG